MCYAALMLHARYSKSVVSVLPAIIFALLTLTCVGVNAQGQGNDTKSVEQAGGYIRSRGNAKVIVFMHGLFSGPEAWRCDEKHFWPEMMANDRSPIVSQYDIYVVKYPTPPRGGKMTLSDLASSIYNLLRTDHVFDRHTEVVFVAHSMGGILTQQLLITYQNEKLSAKVKAIFLYGTPQEGSRIANFGSFFNRDPLIKELESGENNFILPDMDQKWLHGPTKEIKRYCAYETRNENGLKIVNHNSATRGCNDFIAIDTNHRDLVKPCTIRDQSYTYLANTLNDTQTPALQEFPNAQAPPSLPAPQNTPPYEQARRIIYNLEIIIGNYGSAMTQIAQQYASPYKHGMAGQLGPMNGVLPDNLFRAMVDIDHNSSDGYRDVRTGIARLRDATHKCFQLTPNQLDIDEKSYSNADAAALNWAPLDQLRNVNGGNPGRFVPIKDYVNDLRLKLADAHCEMY